METIIKINPELQYKSGVYIITNAVSGKRYVGSSKNIYDRLHQHIHLLDNNTGHNIHFQNSWNKHGRNSFVFGVLEICEPEDRFIKEQHYIDSLKPEYNFSLNVDANFGTSPTQEVRDKISNTLKEKYASGEITTYRQDHTWIKCYIYNIKTWELVYNSECIADALKLLNKRSREENYVKTVLYQDTYIVTFEKFKYKLDLQNYFYKNFYKLMRRFDYLVTEDSKGILTYYKNLSHCCEVTKSSRSTLSKYSKATKDNPYTLHRGTGDLFYYMDNYIPLESQDAVLIEESLEELSGNIGRETQVDNTEINSEITKGSESS